MLYSTLVEIEVEVGVELGKIRKSEFCLPMVSKLFLVQKSQCQKYQGSKTKFDIMCCPR